MKTDQRLKAIVLVNEPDRCDVIRQCLSHRGMDVTVLSDQEEALRLCRDTPPSLAIVEDPLRSMSGTVFLGHLVRISWITSTILIADSDEKQVHERAEGLGILGHVRSPRDKERLDLLLDKFIAMQGS